SVVAGGANFVKERKRRMDKKEILLLQETERKRIAEGLHDTTVQDMICLSQQLELILLYMEQDVARAKLETAAARKQVKRIINEMRETIYELRPMIIDDIGWKASFERLRDKLISENTNLKVCFDIDAVDLSDGVTAISIYRIVCEGCQNMMKHSNADRIDVLVKNDGKLIRICIQDNGVGIEKETDLYKNHFGLQFMSERVDALSGKMKIVSDSSGTQINIEVPAESGVEK
ncbi:MAG: hypothetical protein K2G55_18745, partial [Lachnospiraceae bacterium]|nr:hypothetical protein [Lachnospiraceae bacterium]